VFNLIYSKSAEKVIKKLPKKNQEHIISILERTRIRPHSYFVRLVGKKVYKARAGDYRIIAQIQNNELVILVINVGHRKNIYK
jgi:mRNA interferase RelE/StbE